MFDYNTFKNKRHLLILVAISRPCRATVLQLYYVVDYPKVGEGLFRRNCLSVTLLEIKDIYSLYPQTKVGDILDSGPSRCRRRRRNFLVDAITQKQINIFFSNLVHMLRVPKGRSLF